MTLDQKITKEEFITTFRDAWDKGQDLRFIAVKNSEYKKYFKSHPRFFKNWKEAVKGMGISY
jgi:hypothetical protein